MEQFAEEATVPRQFETPITKSLALKPVTTLLVT
jgi:hypothetical protein